MKSSQEKYDDVVAQLSVMGGKVKRWSLNPFSKHSPDELLDSKTAFIQAMLDGKHRRIFMIETPDENGWLHALEDAWNLADKAGEKALSDKLEEIIHHHMKLAGEY